MKRALVFQHMDYDHPGRFLDFFSEDGIVPEMVRLWEGQKIPNLAPYDFLFVLGGAQDTWQETSTPGCLRRKRPSVNGCGTAPNPISGFASAINCCAMRWGAKWPLPLKRKWGCLTFH